MPPSEDLCIQLAVYIEGVPYLVDVTPPLLGQTTRLEMRKIGQRRPYLVILHTDGEETCSCEGFRRWNKHCKHLRSAEQCGLFHLPVKEASAPAS